MDNVLLEIRNLSKVYDSKGVSVRALSDVNLTVMRGETIGIVGESGCGKTTLGRCVVRGIDATSGEVLFHTEDAVKDFSGWSDRIRVTARGYMLGYFDMKAPGVRGIHRFLAKVGDNVMKMQIVRMDM